MNKQKPFRLVQNDNTRESWLWFPEQERWHKCEEKEFDALKSFAQSLSDAEDPLMVLHYVSLFVNNLEDLDDSSEF
tara:strand:+ start:757 stop:984 length:228 start_codon:yes stop_codon:yes gene_type:complete